MVAIVVVAGRGHGAGRGRGRGRGHGRGHGRGRGRGRSEDLVVVMVEDLDLVYDDLSEYIMNDDGRVHTHSLKSGSRLWILRDAPSVD